MAVCQQQLMWVEVVTSTCYTVTTEIKLTLRAVVGDVSSTSQTLHPAVVTEPPGIVILVNYSSVCKNKRVLMQGM
jgi:hypothetical protein